MRSSHRSEDDETASAFLRCEIIGAKVTTSHRGQKNEREQKREKNAGDGGASMTPPAAEGARKPRQRVERLRERARNIPF